ncbi:hypothetical protein K3495_g11022 [Podosphaera aphanis]|nr:hypothetical protein K3495_g11022 [Podosphaera aphanis]
MYFRDGQSLMIHAEMDRGLYIVKHVLRRLSDKLKNIKPCNAFSTMDIDPTTNKTVSTNDDMSLTVKPSRPIYDISREDLSQSDIKRYILWHKRFAHLGSEILRNLHKVTTLHEAIKIPKNREVCEVCQLTKITNRKSKILADRKDRRPSLIQFNIAGPLPKSLRGNRYFLLIIDSILRKNWILLLKQKIDAIQCLRTFKTTVEKEVNEKIKAARSDNAPKLLLTEEGWGEQDGIEAQSTVVASSHQKGAAERNIRTAEADMRSMLKESNLPIEFWDEAVEADAYMRNRTATGPIISNCVTCPQEAWTNKRPTIDHIKIWGSKCYSYVNPLTIPPCMRKDKLVDRGRIGVFMGYSNTTDKQFKVYSPELGYTTRVSVIKFDESIRGGTIDLRLRNCASGPQGTQNVQSDRKPRGRPIKSIIDSIPKENI